MEGVSCWARAGRERRIANSDCDMVRMFGCRLMFSSENRIPDRLMLENNFPQIWVPSLENRDFATAVVASASHGADAHADHESAAGVGYERGLSLEEKAVQRTRSSTVRETLVSSLGQSQEKNIPGDWKEQRFLPGSPHTLS